MADPHIESPMDVWDKLTVIIYRTGFVIAAFSILALTYLFKTFPLNIPICHVACTLMCAFRLA